MDGRNWNWNCNWKWNNVVDVSPFLLYESTGDSEANSDLNMASSSAGDNNMEVTYEVDDAQSCSSNLSDSLRDNNHHHDQDQEYAQCPKKKDQEYAKCPKKKCKKKNHAQCSKKKEQEYANYDGYNPNYRDYTDDDDEDDGAIDQDWTCGKMGFAASRQKQKQKKKKKNVDSTVEPGKEEEKDNKLFWDKCLGS